MMYFPALKAAAFITRRVCHRKTIKLRESGERSNQQCALRIHMCNHGPGPPNFLKPSTKRPGESSTFGLHTEP